MPSQQPHPTELCSADQSSPPAYRQMRSDLRCASPRPLFFFGWRCSRLRRITQHVRPGRWRYNANIREPCAGFPKKTPPALSIPGFSLFVLVARAELPRAAQVRSLPRHCKVLSPTTEAGIHVEVWSVVEEIRLVNRGLSFVFNCFASSLTPAPLLDILISATPHHRHGGAWFGFKAAFADSVDCIVSSRYNCTASCTSMSPKKPPRSSVSLPSLRFALAAFLLSDPI